MSKDEEVIELKSTVKMTPHSKEGLLKENGKEVRDDSWMHTYVFDEYYEGLMSKEINKKYRTIKEGEPAEKSLFIDLEKGTLNRTKLVQKRVPVKGKNGKVFYRMQWVDPNQGMPGEEKQRAPKPVEHSKRKPFSREPLTSEKQQVEGPEVIPAPVIDVEGKKVFDTSTKEGKVEEFVHELTREGKEQLLSKHNIEWKRNEHPSIDWKNAVQALKAYLQDHPELAGAGHLDSSAGLPKTPDGTDKLQDFIGNTSRDILYKMCKEFGINDGVDPSTIDAYKPKKEGGNGTADIRHFNNMGKLKQYLKDNPQVMDTYKSEGKPVKKEVPGSKPTSASKSKAQEGGNTIEGILNNTSREDLYQLMKRLGINDGVDPSTQAKYGPKNLGGNGTAHLRHFNDMSKLKLAIVKDPSLLNFVDEGKTRISDTEKKRLADMSKEQKSAEHLKSYINDMEKSTKEKLLKMYSQDPIIKDRKTNAHPGTDWMYSMMALKSMFEAHPELVTKHQKDVDNDRMRRLKITNHQMEKVLRRLLGVRGEFAQVKQVEKYKEWEFGLGSFARIEDNEDGDPVLSVVNTGADGSDWEESSYAMKDIAQFVEDLEKDKAEASQPKAEDTPLHKKNILEIEKKLQLGFDKHYTPEVGEVMKPVLADVWKAANKTSSLSEFCTRTNRMGVGTVASLMRKLGIGISPDGKSFDADSREWKSIAYAGDIESIKNKHVTDYLTTDGNGKPETFILHESAKKWTPEERTAARKEFIRTNTNIDRIDDIPQKEQRSDRLNLMLHQSTEFMPFDVLTDMMAHGMKFSFTGERHGQAHRGDLFSTEENTIHLDRGFATDESLLSRGHAFNYQPSAINGIGFHHLGEAVAHEIAHGIDHYMSGHNGFLNWDTEAGRKYAGKHVNCVPQSYTEAVNRSNPSKVLGRGGSANKPYYYHKDEWSSAYEGRIYGNAGDPTGVSRMSKDKNGNLVDSKFDTQSSLAGVEHWSENVSRYANAFHAYKQWKAQNPDDNSTMGQWGYKMSKEFKELGYAGDYEAETNPKLTSYTSSGYRGLHDNHIQGIGYLYHNLMNTHGTLSKGIHHIFDRSDFVTEKTTGYSRTQAHNQGDYARKSEQLVIFIKEE